MCLAVPGKIVSLEEAVGVMPGPTGTIDFNGNRLQASLAFTPDAGVGDWVLVHAGFAISQLDEDEAREVWDLLSHDEGLVDAVPPELRGAGKEAGGGTA